MQIRLLPFVIFARPYPMARSFLGIYYLVLQVALTVWAALPVDFATAQSPKQLMTTQTGLSFG